MLNILIYTLLGLHVIASVLLVLLVLMQRPRSEGLGAAFGGAVTDSLFGSGTTDVLTKMTIGLGSFFFAVTLLLAILFSHRTSSRVQSELLSPAAIDADSGEVLIQQPDGPENTEGAETTPVVPQEIPTSAPKPEKAE